MVSKSYVDMNGILTCVLRLVAPQFKKDKSFIRAITLIIVLNLKIVNNVQAAKCLFQKKLKETKSIVLHVTLRSLVETTIVGCAFLHGNQMI